MTYLELPDLAQVEANLDTWMFETQKLYEQAVKSYIKFKEANISAEIEYTKKFANTISQSQLKGDKVTVIKEKAKSICIAEYQIMLETEAQKVHYEKYIEMYENRINMMKYLMKRKYGEMSNL